MGCKQKFRFMISLLNKRMADSSAHQDNKYSDLRKWTFWWGVGICHSFFFIFLDTFFETFFKITKWKVKKGTLDSMALQS